MMKLDTVEKERDYFKKTFVTSGNPTMFGKPTIGQQKADGVAVNQSANDEVGEIDQAKQEGFFVKVMQKFGCT